MAVKLDPREISRKRAEELRSRIEEYLKVESTIPTGFRQEHQIRQRKHRILEVLGGTEKDWDDWRWQMKHRITDVDTLDEIIGLSEDEKATIAKVGRQFRWAISPYYASLIDPADPMSPIRLMSIPTAYECSGEGKLDPMAEGLTSPVPSVTRRYPDRLIIKVTNQCAMYCRHCQRRRLIGQKDLHTPKEHLEQALDYIRENPEIRDVLITGGDALMLSDAMLDWLLTELDRIPHVEIKRLGTRTLVTLPQRITDDLCRMLEKHHPLYINTQFNHPLEITREAETAAAKLSKAGIPLGNQAVLLNGINNNPHVMKKLNQELLRIRVRPYYIFHAKAVRGTLHFRCRVEDGLEIMENLRGYTSGMAIPTYIINAPNGWGKTPILPNYIVSWGRDKVLLRTWEGRVVEYPNFLGELAEEQYEIEED